MTLSLVFDSLKMHKIKFIFLTVQSIGAYLLIIFFISFLSGVENKVSTVEQTTAPLYKIVDNFTGNEEQSFFSQADNLQVLNDMYSWEKSNQSFTYIIAGRQPIYADIDLPDLFLYSSNQENLYKSLQVNDNFFDYFCLSCRQGQLFSEEDYMITNQPIPVILGSSYADYLKLDQKITLSYLGMSFPCQIIGFLKAGSYYNNTYDLKYLDEYILIPSFEIEDVSAGNRSFLLKLLLDKTNGYAATEYSANEIQQILTAQCLALDIVPYSLEGVSSFFLTMWGLEGKQLQKILIFFSVLLTCSTLLSISLNMISRILINRRQYSVMIVNGLNRKTISLAIILELLLIHLFAAASSLIIAGCFMNVLHSSWLFIFSILLTAASAVIPCLMIHKMNLPNTMRGEY